MLNKVQLIGNLGQDPEIRSTNNGTTVATLSVATSHNYKDKSGNRQENTEWHRVIVWDKTAEFCGNYLSKGNKVYIEGRLQTRKWQDKDGNDKYTTEIIASTVQSLTPKSTGNGRREVPPEDIYGGYAGGGSTGDDIPF
jgi:single-strand DNA-binding protein